MVSASPSRIETDFELLELVSRYFIAKKQHEEAQWRYYIVKKSLARCQEKYEHTKKRLEEGKMPSSFSIKTDVLVSASEFGGAKIESVYTINPRVYSVNGAIIPAKTMGEQVGILKRTARKAQSNRDIARFNLYHRSGYTEKEIDDWIYAHAEMIKLGEDRRKMIEALEKQDEKIMEGFKKIYEKEGDTHAAEEAVPKF